MKDKKLKDATVFTVLSLLYPAYLFTAKEPETIAKTSLFLAIFFPIVAIIFSLNVKDPRFKWGLVILNGFVFCLFMYYGFTILF